MGKTKRRKPSLPVKLVSILGICMLIIVAVCYIKSLENSYPYPSGERKEISNSGTTYDNNPLKNEPESTTDSKSNQKPEAGILERNQKERNIYSLSLMILFIVDFLLMFLILIIRKTLYNDLRELDLKLYDLNKNLNKKYEDLEKRYKDLEGKYEALEAIPRDLNVQYRNSPTGPKVTDNITGDYLTGQTKILQQGPRNVNGKVSNISPSDISGRGPSNEEAQDKKPEVSEKKDSTLEERISPLYNEGTEYEDYLKKLGIKSRRITLDDPRKYREDKEYNEVGLRPDSNGILLLLNKEKDEEKDEFVIPLPGIDPNVEDARKICKPFYNLPQGGKGKITGIKKISRVKQVANTTWQILEKGDLKF